MTTAMHSFQILRIRLRPEETGQLSEQRPEIEGPRRIRQPHKTQHLSIAENCPFGQMELAQIK
jgi:hypothetical protein